MSIMLQEEGGIKACYYHGGMTPGQRIKAQNSWHSGAVQVITCCCCVQSQCAPSMCQRGSSGMLGFGSILDGPVYAAHERVLAGVTFNS